MKTLTQEYTKNDLQQPKSPVVEIQQHPERDVSEQYADILDQAYMAHVGFCKDDQPYVIPFLYHFDRSDPKKIYLHGAHNSRTLKYLREGASICIEVSLLDGLVYSKTALDHSANYRSVVAFGKARYVGDLHEKQAIFESMTRRYFPGRKIGHDYAPATVPDLKRTTLLAVEIEYVSAKSRNGGPNGPLDNDESAPGTAGILECPV